MKIVKHLKIMKEEFKRGIPIDSFTSFNFFTLFTSLVPFMSFTRFMPFMS